MASRPPAKEPVVSVQTSGESEADAFRRAVADANGAVPAGQPEPFLDVGPDLSADVTEYFCPAGIDQALFGDREAAARLTRSRYLQQQDLTGNGVNIVVIDHGFDRTKVRNFGGGWAQGGIVPGATTRGHGPMVVRNICDAAPGAIFWDLPLIPLAIDNVNAFISTAITALDQVLQYIGGLAQPRPVGPGQMPGRSLIGRARARSVSTPKTRIIFSTNWLHRQPISGSTSFSPPAIVDSFVRAGAVAG